MPQEKVSMRKVTEVLRLRFGLGLKQTQIARSCSIGQATVHRYLERAEAVGLSWPLPDGCDERRLQELLFGKTLPEFTPGATRPPAEKVTSLMGTRASALLAAVFPWG